MRSKFLHVSFPFSAPFFTTKKSSWPIQKSMGFTTASEVGKGDVANSANWLSQRFSPSVLNGMASSSPYLPPSPPHKSKGWKTYCFEWSLSKVPISHRCTSSCVFSSFSFEFYSKGFLLISVYLIINHSWACMLMQDLPLLLQTFKFAVFKGEYKLHCS